MNKFKHLDELSPKELHSLLIKAIVNEDTEQVK